MIDIDRIEKSLGLLASGQMLVSDPSAIYYLCGKWIFPGERFAALLIRRKGSPVLFVNRLFRLAEDIGCPVVYYDDTDNVIEILRGHVEASEDLCVDKALPAGFLLPMAEAGLAQGFRLGSSALDHVRSIKDAHEVALMREASRINDKAMGRFKRLAHEGVSEREVASHMLEIYESLGASGFSFEPIVAFGANAADPHHIPDDSVLREGDAVLFDVGCRFHSYCSDMTRTFFYRKEPTQRQREVYNLVRIANEQAEAYVKPGARMCDIDSVARGIIAAAGHGKDFTHRLGHFIGLDPHEKGDVSQASQYAAVPGNIFSIEPGIYRADILGCRIEDLVLVTEDGCEVLNKYPKDIEIIE